MRHDPSRSRLNAALLAAGVLLPAVCGASTAGVLVSQVYGGGGNAGAVWRQDFIELLNAGDSPVSLAGWSVQYHSAAGTGSWQKTDLGPVVLAPGQYFLLQQAAGSGGARDLPPPDAVGGIAMSATSGKVALVSSTVALTGDRPTSPDIVDLVGYGSANHHEGRGTAPAPSNTTAVQRHGEGCVDTDSNADDFTPGEPLPRHSASPPHACAGAGPGRVSIPEIQGRGPVSPLAGASVRSSGVVTRVSDNGFFLQDLAGDGEPATSDGLFVHTGRPPEVRPGQLIELAGTVVEFDVGGPGNADTAAHTVTQLTGVSDLQVLASGHEVAPVTLTLPVASQTEFERLEGMLVTVDGPLSVSQNYFQGRYGQVTLSAGGRLETPTNRHRPGTRQAQALSDANARARLILDDGSSAQNPDPTPWMGEDGTLRAGDTVARLTGVLDYGLATASRAGAGGYRLLPTLPVVFSRTNARTAAPAPLPGNLKLASFNVLNYFTTFTDGTDADGRSGQGCWLGDSHAASNCRGASNLQEFLRQRAKIVEAIAAIDADALGLVEMQNNGRVAVQNLADALNVRVGAGSYAVVADPPQGTGSDAVKLAMIYRPARLTPVGRAQSDTDPVHHRPPLAQTFATANGERFTLVVNHLKSKGSCPSEGDPEHEGNFDTGDGQGCWNALRVAQARRTADWVAGLAPAAGTDAALLLGDFNAYAQEDPLQALADAGYADQIARHEAFGYSYVFDGAAGRLDHALASASLAASVTGAAPWHINADEPPVIDYNMEFKQPQCATCGPDPYTPTAYRASDHDPVLAGLYLVRRLQGAAGGGGLVGTPGDDQLVGGEGTGPLTGGAGEDVFSLVGAGAQEAIVTDFVPGQDRLDLRALLSGRGMADPVLRLRDGAQGVRVQLGSAGTGAHAAWRTVAVLQGVKAAELQMARDFIVQHPRPAARK